VSRLIEQIIMASQANSAKSIINKLKHERIKHMNNSLNLAFNKTCKKEGLIPNYIAINIRNKSEAAKKTLRQARRIWLNNEIKFLYKKSNNLVHNIKLLKAKLRSKIPKHELGSVIHKINDKICKKKKQKSKVLQQKLTKLRKSQKVGSAPTLLNHKFYPRVINLTNINLTQNEESILGKINKYNPTDNLLTQQNITELVIETETALSYVKKDIREKIRYEAANKLEKIISKSKQRRIRYKRRHTNERQTMNQIKAKILQNKAKTVSADKSNSTVIISEEDLNKKVNEFFSKNKVSQITDKTNQYNKNIKSLIRSSCVINPDAKKHLYNPQAKAPKFRPLVKTHKPDYPIRPIVNCIDSPSYKLSKYICNLIKSVIPTESVNTCKNSQEFIDKIKNVKMEKNHVLVTVDVENMYANIPCNEALEALGNRLTRSKKFSNEEINDIMTMVMEILKQNYFEWNNSIYQDPNGLPMGGPLSALLAEIYLQQFEESFILNNRNPHFNKIKFYCRYVDDIIILIRSTIRQTKQILNHLNNIHETVKFKMENEKDHTINFLDVKVIKSGENVKFGIHHKPTQTDLIIPKDSNHPYAYKMSAFRSMVNRLLSYNLSPEEYEKERCLIKTIAYNNGYEPNLIDNIIRKTKFQKAKNNPTSTKNDKTYIPFNYMGVYSETIGNVFRKHNIQPGYKIKNKHYFDNSSNKCNIKKEHTKGVYMIECNNGDKCNKKYIGFTNRNFYDRFKEHNAIKQNNPASMMAKHLKENKGHSIDFSKSMSVLKRCNNRKKANIWEEYSIYKYCTNHGNDSLLNKKEDFSDKITYKILNQLDSENN